MFAIVGLGNPGDEYAKTRHNSGFLCVDELGKRLGANYWKDECGAQVAHVKAACKQGMDHTVEGPVAGNSKVETSEILLVKPQSFMNTSGGPVKQICQKYDIAPGELIIVHDDMDIECGKIRVKVGGGSAGHNGLKSLDAKLGTPKYARVRVGVGHPTERMPVVDYVLREPRGADAENWAEGIITAADAAEFLLTHTLSDTQQQFN